MHWYFRPYYVSPSNVPHSYAYVLFRNIPNSGRLVRIKSIHVINSNFSIGLRDSAALNDPGGPAVQGTEIGAPYGLNMDRSSYTPADHPDRYSKAEGYGSQLVGGPIMGQGINIADGPSFHPAAGEIVLPPDRAVLIRSGSMGEQMIANFVWTEEALT